MRHVFIVGAKGISFYGGYESFVQKLLQYNNNDQIKYHVACKANGEGAMDVSKLDGVSDFTSEAGRVTGRFEYYGADCFLVRVNEKFGKAQAIAYDIEAIKECIRYIRENSITDAIVYVLACRIGPFFGKYVDTLHKLGASVYLNPDGHEWKRAKWSAPVRKYWKESERLMIKNVDLIICDSVNIEKYVKSEYAKYSPQTTYISYGAEVRASKLSDNDEKYVNWLKEHNLTKGNMYLQVGRLVPENNFETVIREFMRSNTTKDLVIIATKNEVLQKKLEDKYRISADKRIKFVGTVYDQELLMKIREDAYAYIHGHSVGGTNPSLLEALSSTKLNLLYDVCFNKEVAGDAALYWDLRRESLYECINKADNMSTEIKNDYGRRAKLAMIDRFSWTDIVRKYEFVFLRDIQK